MRPEPRIVVADAARARIFGLTRNQRAGTSALVELASLEDRERRLVQSERYSDTRPGTQRASMGGPAHAVDDRRDAHDRELDRRFAREIAARVNDLSGQTDSETLLLVASPHMLPELVDGLEKLPKRRHVETVVADLVNLSPPRLHDHLAREGHVPERGRLRWRR